MCLKFQSKRDEGSEKMYLDEKKEYIAIDIMKFLCALLVVSIHIPAFSDVNAGLSFWFNQVLCRMAVPFFFVSSGYFSADKLKNRGETLRYVKRLLILYSIYTFLYIPQILFGYVKKGKSASFIAQDFIRQFFLVGSYWQLWYFVSLIAAVAVLYLFRKVFRLGIKRIIMISAVLYIIGVLGNAYQNVFLNVPILGNILKIYYSIFETTRNGLFFGLFFTAAGYLIKMYNDKIQDRKYLFVCCAAAAFLFLNIEVYMAKYYADCEAASMFFAMPFVTIPLFLILCFIKIPERYLQAGRMLRKMSVLIFGLHMFVDFYVGYILRPLLNSLAYYCVVIGVTCMLSCVIIKLSKTKYLKALHYMY